MPMGFNLLSTRTILRFTPEGNRPGPVVFLERVRRLDHRLLGRPGVKTSGRKQS
jgi:hypothetical protein